MGTPTDVETGPPADVVPAATVVISKRGARGRRRHAASAAETDEASRSMIADIVKRLHRQARVLRGLGYAVYRYSTCLAGHYDARADALALAQINLGARFTQVVRAMSPDTVDFGKAPRNPAEQLLDAARDVVVSSRRGGQRG